MFQNAKYIFIEENGKIVEKTTPSMFEKIGDILRESLDSEDFLNEKQKEQSKFSEESKIKEKNETQKIKEEAIFSEKIKKSETVGKVEKNVNAKKFDFESFFETEAKNERKNTAQIYRPIKISEELRQAFLGIGISENASVENAKKIYRERLQYYHPDKWIGTIYEKQAQENTQKIIAWWRKIEAFFENQCE